MFGEPMTSFSLMLGEERLLIVPNTKKATTNQIPIRPRLSSSLNAMPDFAMTISDFRCHRKEAEKATARLPHDANRVDGAIATTAPG